MSKEQLKAGFDLGLKILVPLLLAAVIGAFSTIWAHESRLIKVEATTEGLPAMKRMLEDMRVDLARQTAILEEMKSADRR